MVDTATSEKVDRLIIELVELGQSIDGTLHRVEDTLAGISDAILAAAETQGRAVDALGEVVAAWLAAHEGGHQRDVRRDRERGV